MSIQAIRVLPRTSILTRTLFEIDIPFVGQVNVHLVGNGSGSRSLISVQKAEGYAEVWLGNVRVEFDYMPETRFKRGTLAVLGMTVLSVAGWTEGHLWRVPFLG